MAQDLKTSVAVDREDLVRLLAAARALYGLDTAGRPDMEAAVRELARAVDVVNSKRTD